MPAILRPSVEVPQQARSRRTLDSTGRSVVDLGGTHQTGYAMRVRSSYVDNASGDTVNSTTHGSWKYFTFTN
ncbi:hypothetical protein [Streptomyces collinus]|uniref:hypothetical protein n=1 Tax=Streptomyces collinus TaxID=42684 RepID=UPI003326A21B